MTHSSTRTLTNLSSRWVHDSLGSSGIAGSTSPTKVLVRLEPPKLKPEDWQGAVIIRQPHGKRLLDGITPPLPKAMA